MNIIGSYLVGVASPFLLLAAIGASWITVRKIGRMALYAKPKYLERRLNLAAEFVDARRAYRIGGRRVWIALVVGRQWTHDQQARAVLKDEFVPLPDEAPGLAELAAQPRRYQRIDP